jgi:hypothetical protein
MSTKVPRPYRPLIPVESWTLTDDDHASSPSPQDAPDTNATTRRDALQAIFDALATLAPQTIDWLAERQAQPGGVSPDDIERWGRALNLGLGAAVFDIFASCHTAPQSEERLRLIAFGAGNSSHGGTATTIGWRVDPHHHDRAEVRRAIIADLEQKLDHIYAQEQHQRERPFLGRKYLQRNAEHLVLRQVFDCSLEQIVDYEDGLSVRMPDGTTLQRVPTGVTLNDGGDESWLDDPDNEFSSEVQRRKRAIHKSIEAIAALALISLPERPRGRRPKGEAPDDPIYRDYLQ